MKRRDRREGPGSTSRGPFPVKERSRTMVAWQHHHDRADLHPACRDRSHPHWLDGCSPRKSLVQCIRAGWCHGCGTACPCHRSRGIGRASPLDLSRRLPCSSEAVQAGASHPESASNPAIPPYAHRGQAGPSLWSLAHGRAVPNCLAPRQHVVDEGSTRSTRIEPGASFRWYRTIWRL